jgi:glycerate 2-kinase
MIEPTPHIEDVLEIFRSGIRGVDPTVLLSRNPLESYLGKSPEAFGRIVAVGGGKASIPMAAAVESQLGDRIDH